MALNRQLLSSGISRRTITGFCTGAIPRVNSLAFAGSRVNVSEDSRPADFRTFDESEKSNSTKGNLWSTIHTLWCCKLNTKQPSKQHIFLTFEVIPLCKWFNGIFQVFQRGGFFKIQSKSFPLKPDPKPLNRENGLDWVSFTICLVRDNECYRVLYVK